MLSTVVCFFTFVIIVLSRWLCIWVNVLQFLNPSANILSIYTVGCLVHTCCFNLFSKINWVNRTQQIFVVFLYTTYFLMFKMLLNNLYVCTCIQICIYSHTHTLNLSFISVLKDEYLHTLLAFLKFVYVFKSYSL